MHETRAEHCKVENIIFKSPSVREICAEMRLPVAVISCYVVSACALENQSVFLFVWERGCTRTLGGKMDDFFKATC
jgi:hypothetical protein